MPHVPKVVVILLMTLGLAGLWIHHRNTSMRYERDRTRLEWQAAKLAERVQAAGKVPEAWGAGVWLADDSMRALLGTLKGTRITSERDDVTVVIDDLGLASNPTFMQVTLTLSATSLGRGASFKAKAVTELVFLGTTQTTSDTMTARFGLVPIEIVPEVAWLGLDWKGGTLASDMIKGAALARVVSAAPIALPFQNRFHVDPKRESVGTLPINKDLGSTLTYRLDLPQIELGGSLEAVSPLFVDGGLWLLSNESAVRGIDAAPDPGDLSHDVMASETQHIRKRLTDVRPPPADLAVWLGSAPVLSAVGRIAALPDDRRRAAFRSVKVNGQIARKEWSDKILGKGGVFAYLEGDDAVKGTIDLGEVAAAWDAKEGVSLLAKVAVDAEAKVHVHVDPLVGGGVGTPFKLLGKANTELGASLRLGVERVDGSRVLVARAEGRCATARIALRTDGVAKTDFGWTKVPSVGIVREQSLNLSVPPMAILDDMPHVVSGRDEAGRPKVAIVAGRELGVEPAWRYLSVSVGVTSADATASGWLIGADLWVNPTDAPDDPALVAAARKRINEAISVPSPSPCSQEGSTAVTLGPLEFGPNNEIVKFFVSLGKLTKEMADRIGHEVSADKLKEWVNDPAGSFARSDPGKAVGGVVNAIPNGIGSYCSHNWCP